MYAFRIATCGLLLVGWLEPYPDDTEYPDGLIWETDHQVFSSGVQAAAAGVALFMTAPHVATLAGATLVVLEIAVIADQTSWAIKHLEDAWNMRQHNERVRDKSDHRERMREQKWFLKAMGE